MPIKYILLLSFFLVGCGGGGVSIDSVVDEIVDQNDSSDDLPATFDALEKVLPWGLHDKTGAATALGMALYGGLSSQFLARVPIVPVPVEPNDDECDFGGNVISTFNLNTSDVDYVTYSISRNASNCRTDEVSYFDGYAELDGIFDSRNPDLDKDTIRSSANNFSRYSTFGSIANRYPLKSQLTSVRVLVSGDFNQYVETDTRQDRQDDTVTYFEDSSSLIYSVSGNQNAFELNSHDRESMHKDLNGNDAFTDNVLVTTVSKANYSSSWVMKNNAEGNMMIRAAGFFAGSPSGMGYKTTFPEGSYSLSVQVLTPIVRDESAGTVFPSEGSLLVDLSSHNISAILSFSGGAQISISTNGVNVVTNFDKSGQVIQ